MTRRRRILMIPRMSHSRTRKSSTAGSGKAGTCIKERRSVSYSFRRTEPAVRPIAIQTWHCRRPELAGSGRRLSGSRASMPSSGTIGRTMPRKRPADCIWVCAHWARVLSTTMIRNRCGMSGRQPAAIMRRQFSLLICRLSDCLPGRKSLSCFYGYSGGGGCSGVCRGSG